MWATKCNEIVHTHTHPETSLKAKTTPSSLNSIPYFFNSRTFASSTSELLNITYKHSDKSIEPQNASALTVSAFNHFRHLHLHPIPKGHKKKCLVTPELV